MAIKANRGILMFFGIVFSFSLYANCNDTIKTPKLNVKDSSVTKIDSIAKFYFYSENFGSHRNKDYTPIDTMFNGFQKYDPANELYPFHTSLGNIGLANKNMVYEEVGAPGFNLGNRNFDSYLFSSENFKFYKGLTPFSSLFYLMGAKKEQYFDATHSRNLSKNFTIGINYRKIVSPGYYNWQSSNNTNAALSSYYMTTNKRYGFIASYIFNRIRAYENGGIARDSVNAFEENIEPNRQLINVNLNFDHNQKRINNIREHSIYIKQFYVLGFNKSNKINDTTEEKVFRSLGMLNYTFKLDNSSLYYDDNYPSSGFYNNIYYDLTNTHDSTHLRKIENKLSFSNKDNETNSKNHLLYYEIGVTNQLINISQCVFKPFSPLPESSSKLDTTISRLIDTTFSQYIIEAELNSDPEKMISLGFNIHKIIGGYNNKDYGNSAFVLINLSDSIKTDKYLLLKAGYYENETSWLNQRYYSNHFRWDYDFLKTKTLYSSVNFTYKTFSTHLEYYILDNFVYFNKLVNPQQYSSKINLINLSVYKNFHLGNWCIDNAIIYQNVLKGDTILRLPELIFNHSIYYNDVFFKGALYSQFGLDVFYNTAYYADSYTPCIREFYLQDTQKIGNYPYIDVFLNFKIKRVRFFLKYQHVTQGLFGYKYYTTPNYPMQDRAIKFGLSWIFHN